MSQFLDAYEVVLDTLVSEDVLDIFTKSELDRGSIWKSDDMLGSVVAIHRARHLLLERVEEVLFYFWKSSTQNKAVHRRSRETLVRGLGSEPV